VSSALGYPRPLQIAARCFEDMCLVAKDKDRVVWFMKSYLDIKLAGDGAEDLGDDDLEENSERAGDQTAGSFGEETGRDGDQPESVYEVNA